MIKGLTRDPRYLLIVVACILIANGCHTRASKPEIDASPPPPRKSLYIVRQGDTLAQIAQHVTGASQNWQRIARHNHIKDPTKLRIGRVVTIPIELLPRSADDKTAEVAPAPVANDVVLAAPLVTRETARMPKQMEPANTSQEQLVSVAMSPPVVEQVIERSVDTADVVNDAPAPVAATVSQPLTRQIAKRVAPKPYQATIKPPPRPAPTPRWIVLTGSYYPREVKHAPELGAATLALVQPGTRFQSLGLIDGWHKIMTDEGEGYVHPSDVRLEQ